MLVQYNTRFYIRPKYIIVLWWLWTKPHILFAHSIRLLILLTNKPDAKMQNIVHEFGQIQRGRIHLDCSIAMDRRLDQEIVTWPSRAKSERGYCSSARPFQLFLVFLFCSELHTADEQFFTSSIKWLLVQYW